MADNPDRTARARMDRQYLRWLDLCARAYGVGSYAGSGPHPEATKQLEALLDKLPSKQELADLKVVGWSPQWRRDFLTALFLARKIAGDDIALSGGSSLTPRDDNVTPQTRN